MHTVIMFTIDLALIFVKGSYVYYRWFSPDVTDAMLVHRRKEKKVFWEFDSVIMQNMSHHLLLFCAPTWPSYHLTLKPSTSPIKEIKQRRIYECQITFLCYQGCINIITVCFMYQ